MIRTKLTILVIGVIVANCSRQQPSGGPCNYESIDVSFEVTQVYDSIRGYKIKATPRERSVFDQTYTNPVQYILAEATDTLHVGDQFDGSMSIMTKGACNPTPLGIKLTDGTHREVVHPEELK